MSKQLTSAFARHVLPFTRRANNMARPLVSHMNRHQQASLPTEDFVKVAYRLFYLFYFLADLVLAID